MIKQISIEHIKGRLTKGLIGFLALWCFFHFDTYKQDNVIRHDMTSYYGYLPAAFIYRDLSLQNIPDTEKQHYEWVIQSENGPVFRMTMGVALLNTPAFLAGHAFSLMNGQESNGYNSTYYFFLLLSALFFFYRGLLLCFRLANRYTSFYPAILSTLLIGFATNLFYYTFDEGLMSHVYSFYLYALLLESTLRWHEEPNKKQAMAIGFALGMLTLIRPIHALAVLIPLLYSPDKAKWLKLKQHASHVLWIALIGLLCISPQLLYWKYMSGSWLFYSYGDERFFFSEPVLLKGLFGFRKGWLLYTPVMAVALLGIIRLWKLAPAFRLSLLFIPIYIWVVFSWWCWWYGGSFGSRPMIDIYALLAIPLAMNLAWLRKFTRSNLVFPMAFSLLFISLNLFQTKQYKITLLHWDGMNQALYERIWLNPYFPENYEALVKSPNYEAAKKGYRDQ